VPERVPASSRLLEEASDLLHWDVGRLVRGGAPEGPFQDSHFQVASFVANAIYWEFWKGRGLTPAVLTGYSLGFYSALMAAKVFPFSMGLILVWEAGRLMEEASSLRPGRMAAVFGLLADEVDQICQEARGVGLVAVANLNAARQVVISGEEAAVQEACLRAMDKGALEIKDVGVGVAYHSSLMDAPSRRFGSFLEDFDLRDPELPVLSYVDAEYVKDGTEARDLLSRQLRSQIRWKDCIERLVKEGVDTFIEAGPGQMLTRLTRWISRGTRAYATDDPAILEHGFEGRSGGQT
jgi:[acyl-carrier-protein] S-malonyltransferase